MFTQVILSIFSLIAFRPAIRSAECGCTDSLKIRAFAINCLYYKGREIKEK